MDRMEGDCGQFMAAHKFNPTMKRFFNHGSHDTICGPFQDRSLFRWCRLPALWK